MSSLVLKDGLLKHLEDLVFFLEYQEANPFKIRAFQNAIPLLEGLSNANLTEKIADGSLIEMKGIGKGILALAKDYLRRQSSEEFETATKDLPLELLELKQIRGLSAKKIRTLYEELGIKTLGELEYACQENRLLKLKGFGTKIQVALLDEIEKAKERRTKFLLSDAIETARPIVDKLLKGGAMAAAVGELGSRLEIVSKIKILSTEALKSSSPNIQIEIVEPQNFYWEFVRRTSSTEHWNSLTKFLEQSGIKQPEKIKWAADSEIYSAAKVAYYPAEAREYSIAPKIKFEAISEKNLTGVFHLHTSESDGINTLEEMAAAAQSKGWSYMGLSDHSQTSFFYANGLKVARLEEQWKEVDALNKKQKTFKILKGVESDILKDGSLDYPTSVLKKLDFVIGSIHSRYGMTDMTQRLLAAIENPFTSMIGHISGRLLLARDPYEFDTKRIVDAAIANKRVIEINSHPQRLDMDWRILHDACARGLYVSINPDAHSVAGFDDTRFGVWLANKALIPHEQIINTWPLEKIESFLEKQR